MRSYWLLGVWCHYYITSCHKFLVHMVESCSTALYKCNCIYVYCSTTTRQFTLMWLGHMIWWLVCTDNGLILDIWPLCTEATHVNVVECGSCGGQTSPHYIHVNVYSSFCTSFLFVCGEWQTLVANVWMLSISLWKGSTENPTTS